MKHARIHILIALLLGVLAGVLIPVPQGQVGGHILAGWVTACLLYTVPMMAHLMATSHERTQHFVGGQGSRTQLDVVVVAASLASLAAIGYFLLSSSGSGANASMAIKTVNAGLALGSVVGAWLSVHVTYALRYARHWYLNEPGCVDFNTTHEPRMSDFVYLAFTLGMTYQVSDTDIKTPAMRRIILWHTLLSYLFGTGIVAATINLIVSTAG